MIKCITNKNLSSNCLSIYTCGQIQPKSNMSHKELRRRDNLFRRNLKEGRDRCLRQLENAPRHLLRYGLLK